MVKQRCHPILFSTIVTRKCTHPCRTFVKSATDYYPIPKAIPPPKAKKAAPSARAARNGGIKESNIPYDLGLMDGTLIMPTGKSKPPLVGDLRSRIQLEWFRVKKRFMDFLGVLLFKFSVTKKPTPRPKIAFRSIGPTAHALHNQMWTAFADRDLTVLRTICAEGLYNLLASRIAARPRDDVQRWTSHSSVPRPRVVSHRSAMLPLIPRSALRQAVVRLETRQSMEQLLPNGNIVAGTDEIKEFTEYIVIQKRILKEKEEPWMIWGTVEESDWKTLLQRS